MTPDLPGPELDPDPEFDVDVDVDVDDQIDPGAEPSGAGCVECLDVQPAGWWFHLRRCATCGHIGCCDSSPGQHATAHFQQTGHRAIRSFEPDEDWFYDYVTGRSFAGPALAGAQAHPVEQPSPGPLGAVPQDWKSHLH